MRQKVVIACGLVRDATTLLFDEPLTGLDPLGIRRMRETIVARARAGAAILLSSHLLHLVEEVCTRVIIMDHGRKVADGTVAELASRADLAEAGSNLEQIFLHVTGHDDPTPRDAEREPVHRRLHREEPRRVRLRRLREPRYLIGAIVGSAYLYFAVFNRGGSGRGGPRGSGRGLAGLAAAWQATGSSLAGLAVFALAACVWLLPSPAVPCCSSRARRRRFCFRRR